jgi:Protein of unknown function (DUF2490)
MKIHIYITIFLFLLNNTAFAQEVPHLNFWSKFSLSQPISKKWRAEIEFQHRRQNDFSQQKKDVLDENLLSSVRTWVHYQHNDDLSFSFSPLAKFWQNSIIVEEEDKQKPQVSEIRFSIAADLKHEVVKKLWLIDRTSIEYRYFQNTSTNIIRMQNRFGFRYKFTEKWNLTCYNEVFLNLKGAIPANFFDHNRIGLLLNYKPTKNVRIETGYLYIARLPRNSNKILIENDFLINIYYTILGYIYN